jgi:aspartyl/asparaginyl beta-hydroxylase (cupin superfamily)
MQLTAAEAQVAIQAGIAALQRRDGAAARRHFDEIIERGSPLPPPWFPLAQACRMVGDRAAEEAALDKLLAAEPRHLGALILKGDFKAGAGDSRAAVSFYRAAINVAGQAGQLPPGLAAEMKRVEQALKKAEGDFQAHLEQVLSASSIGEGARSRRFAQAIDIMLGKREIYLQQPNSFYYPGLPQIEYYEPDDFPWLREIVEATAAMRAELQAVIEEEGAFAPYVEANPDRPLPANHLLGDPSWAAFYLWKGGAPVAENAARCPRTMAALAHAPMPRIAGRSPMALFSRLRPGAHIKPHHGLLNTRLIVHVPLIAPPGCHLRVGGETREWREGEALVFDDSIEHEAWNRSDRTRTVLLFEIWRPEIGEEERAALTAMFEAIGNYGAEPDGSDA